MRACLCTRFYCCGAAQTAHLSLRLGSGPLPLNVHHELSIRELIFIFFRRQGTKTVTVKRFAGAYLDLCDRLPMYKAPRAWEPKTELIFLVFLCIDCQNQVSDNFCVFFQTLFQNKYLFFGGFFKSFKKSPLRYIKITTGILYFWESSFGDVWKTFGDDNTHPKYVGEIKNGKPDGLCILYNGTDNFDGGFNFYIWKGVKHVGSWKNGKPHGEGRFEWGDSDRVGEWRNGKDWNTIS